MEVEGASCIGVDKSARLSFASCIGVDKSARLPKVVPNGRRYYVSPWHCFKSKGITSYL